MSAITNLDKPVLRALRVELDAALAEIGARHGISIATGSASYTPTTCTMKINIAVATSPGVFEDPRRVDFKRLAQFYGLKAEDLDRVFSYAGQVYRVSGLNQKARTSPIIAERAGRFYKFSSDIVVSLLASSAATKQ